MLPNPQFVGGGVRWRFVLIVLAILVAASAGASWLWVIEPVHRHLEFCRATRAEFESLAKKRPPTVTRKQWQSVVAWTLLAHGNCISGAHNIPQAERDRFLTGLRERLRGPVELATIDWIWDELVRLTSTGQRYSDRWRPTTPERLREFEVDNVIWDGLEVD